MGLASDWQGRLFTIVGAVACCREWGGGGRGAMTRNAFIPCQRSLGVVPPVSAWQPLTLAGRAGRQIQSWRACVSLSTELWLCMGRVS